MLSRHLNFRIRQEGGTCVSQSSGLTARMLGWLYSNTEPFDTVSQMAVDLGLLPDRTWVTSSEPSSPLDLDPGCHPGAPALFQQESLHVSLTGMPPLLKSNQPPLNFPTTDSCPLSINSQLPPLHLFIFGAEIRLIFKSLSLVWYSPDICLPIFNQCPAQVLSNTVDVRSVPSTFNTAEERINELQDRSVENI